VKNMIRKYISLILIIFLTGCQFEHLQEVNTCQSSCRATYEQCRPLCQDSCPNCCGNSYSKAKHSYQRYVHEKDITGDPSINLLQSFDDHLKCNKNSCNCQADYILCKQACEGQITKRLKTFKPC
jgi:hypothetical protein